MRDREHKLDRAVDAIIRGLVHGAGASSPLLADYFSEREELLTWDARRRKVAKLAPLYPYNHGAPANTASTVIRSCSKEIISDCPSPWLSGSRDGHPQGACP